MLSFLNDYTIIALIWIVIILLGAHILGAIAGFGGALLAIPPLILLLGSREDAVHLMSVVGLFQPLVMFIYTRKHIKWKYVLLTLSIVLPFLPIGYFLASSLPKATLLILLAFLAGGTGILTLREKKIDRKPLPHFINWLLMGLGGIIHGAFAASGTVLVITMRNYVPEKDAFRGSITMLWVVLNSSFLLLLVTQGDLTKADWVQGLYAAVIVIVGTAIGNIIAKYITQRHFVRLVSILLLIASAILLSNALREIRHAQAKSYVESVP